MEISYDLTKIDRIADRLIEEFDSKIILFYGEMGSGKTTLIRSLVKSLGCQDDVSSPTFSIVNEYQLETGNTLFQFDFYRIKDDEELMNLGFEDYFNTDSWVFIEWPELALDQIPETYNSVTLNIEPNSRTLKLSQKTKNNL